MEQQRVSLRPSSFTAGGSLIDDVDITITRARFGFGYGESKGNSDADSAITLQVTLVDSDGTEHQSFYSVGNGFVPSETGDEATNGLYLVPTGERTAMNGGSNAALFLNSLVQAGLPEDLLDGDINAVEGTQGHVNRVPAPKRSGLPKRASADGKEREATILLMTSISALPGEKKAAAKANSNVKQMAGKATTTAKPTAAPKSNVDQALVDEMESELIGHFSANDLIEMKKVDIVKALFNSADLKANPNRAAILKLAASDEALKAMGSFTFDGKLLTMAG